MGLRFRESLACFAPDTLVSIASVLLDGLDGKKKSSTIKRWLNEVSLFGRTVAKELQGRKISTITLSMYMWYTSQKNASQVKLLRSPLLQLMKIDAPCLAKELITCLQVVPPPKARATTEIQNTEQDERPFSIVQVQLILAALSRLYLSGTFNPQTYLIWRLLISEGMRPSQMCLLRVGDLQIVRDEHGRVQSVLVTVPLVKQAGTSARDYKRLYRLSNALAVAMVDHLDFMKKINGISPSEDFALFCVRKANGFEKEDYRVSPTHISIQNVLNTTRIELAACLDGFYPTDLFSRRFKHTKLTHLAQTGASIEALAYAGYQTSTVSLGHYVNLTDEWFELYEEQLESTHALVVEAFEGKLVKKGQSKYSDIEHEITDLRIDSPVGACSREPCEALACLACYGCPRFEAFEDGPHRQIEAILLEEQAKAVAAGLSERAINLRANILAAVRTVIKLIDGANSNAADRSIP